eukprot:m.64972 g.64972  ORF g.64972 m.64972 type:complete len:382 (+) comp8134_c2_seq1:125-1270(+)
MQISLQFFVSHFIISPLFLFFLFFLIGRCFLLFFFFLISCCFLLLFFFLVLFFSIHLLVFFIFLILIRWKLWFSFDHSVERNTSTKAEHALDASSKLNRVLQGKSGTKTGRVNKHSGSIQQGLVHHAFITILVSLGKRLGTLQKILDKRVAWIDLEGLLLSLIERGLRIVGAGISLGLHDSLHVARPAVLASNKGAWGFRETIGNNSLLDLIRKVGIQPVSKRFEFLLQLLLELLGSLGIVKGETLLCNVLELLVLKLWKILDGVLIHRLGEVQHLVATLEETLNEGRLLGLSNRLGSHEVDVLLVLLHALNVIEERSVLVIAVGRIKAEELGKTGAVLVVIHEPKFDACAKALPKFLEIFWVELLDHLKGLTHELLLDHL